AECMLVLIGATPEGKKELIGFRTGMRESAQSWKELLVDLKARGLSIAPKVAVGDGALGFWKALDETFPSTRHQRCWLHKTLNVLDKFPKSMQPNVDLPCKSGEPSPMKDSGGGDEQEQTKTIYERVQTGGGAADADQRTQRRAGCK